MCNGQTHFCGWLQKELLCYYVILVAHSGTEASADTGEWTKEWAQILWFGQWNVEMPHLLLTINHNHPWWSHRETGVYVRQPPQKRTILYLKSSVEELLFPIFLKHHISLISEARSYQEKGLSPPHRSAVSWHHCSPGWRTALCHTLQKVGTTDDIDQHCC